MSDTPEDLGSEGQPEGLEPAEPSDRLEAGSSPAPPVPRTERRRRRTRLRWLRWSALVVALLFLAVLAWYEISAHPFGGPGPEVTVHVAPGQSYSAAVSSFEQAGVLSDALAFRLYSVIHGTPSVLPGYYTAPKNSTFGYVHTLLSLGPNSESVSVPPGFTLQEVANRLDQTVNAKFAETFAGLLRSGAVRSPFEPAGSSNLEGLIAPGRYLVTPSSTPKGLLSEMVTRFVPLAASVGLTPSTVERGHDPYTLVTMASVVEKEGYYVKNMPQVATVIENRLAKAMPLQMDSTVLYALGQDGGRVTAAQLRYPSPYNTYLHTGLPPTPICTVSKAALAAAMHPPQGTWLYFTLIDKDGTMAFSTTFQEQLKNEALAASKGL